MRKRLTTICCSALALFLALPTWAAAQNEGPVKARFGQFPVASLWTVTLEAALAQPPGFFADRAVLALDNGHLTAFDLHTGKPIWTVDRRSAVAPVLTRERVFVLQDQTLTALDSATGAPAWEITLPSPLAAPLSAVDGWLLALDASGQLTAYRATDGSQIWSVATGGPAKQSPAIEGERAYVARDDGTIVALRIENGSQVWTRRIGGAPQPILALSDRLYVGSDDNYLYCLMVPDGRIDWRWRTGGDVIGRPAFDDDRVYIVSLDTLARALDRRSGAQRWKQTLTLRPTGGIVAAPEALLVSGVTSAVQGLAMKDGAALPALDAGGLLAAPPHIAPSPSLPSSLVVVVARSLKSGNTLQAFTRTLEPPATPIQPLPGPNAPRTPGGAPASTPGSPATAPPAGSGAGGSTIGGAIGEPPPGLPAGR